jgi:hypothetical protein
MSVRSLILLLATCLHAVAIGQERPRLPYSSWGACPFECCTYRAWKAEQPVVAFKKRDASAPVAFQVAKGEWVRAIGGVVITQRYRVTEVLKHVELDYGDTRGRPPLRLEPGDVLYPLHYEGEGFYRFWYKGSVYSDAVSGDVPDPIPPSPAASLHVREVPRFTWWAKIRNKKGEVGWTNVPGKFSNSGACGAG